MNYIPLENLTAKSNTNLLAYLTLEVLGFVIKPRREVMMHQEVTLTMNGKKTSSYMDVHIVDVHFPSYLAVGIVEGDNKANPYAHLIGISIGVFQSNNAVRIRYGKPHLDVLKRISYSKHNVTSALDSAGDDMERHYSHALHNQNHKGTLRSLR